MKRRGNVDHDSVRSNDNAEDQLLHDVAGGYEYKTSLSTALRHQLHYLSSSFNRSSPSLLLILSLDILQHEVFLRTRSVHGFDHSLSVTSNRSF